MSSRDAPARRLPRLELPAGPGRRRGEAHGEHFRRPIHEIARIRLDLALAQGRFRSEDEVLDVARAHLPVLDRWDRDLADELVGIAHGADLDLARVVVLNHYTDLKDIDPARPEGPSASRGDDEDCSAVAAGTGDGPLLAQTWDMHGSAEPFVAMLRVPEVEGAPEAWVFTIAGCVGMTGLNAAGLGVTINNLKSRDARVGVVWPALVRRLLREPSARAARHALVTAPLSSGHHYLLADADEALAIETSGGRKEEVWSTAWAQRGERSPPSFVHTNHALGGSIAEVSWVPETSTTHARYDALCAGLDEAPIAGRGDLWARLGSHDGYPRSVCTHLASPAFPHGMKTCGGLLMELGPRRLWAAAGCLNGVAPEAFAPGGAPADGVW
ncbi:MAG: C45 family autoproteolytic acyltransferase/hydrolase [Sandaracinaceae bacterium]